jgi:hypothetical protein
MRDGRSVGRALAVLVVLAGGLVFAFAAPAAADPNVPPGWQDPGNNAWVGFRLDPLQPAASGRTSYDPVTLIRETSSGLDLLTAFNNWEPGPDADNNGTPDTYFWPPVWEANGVRLERVTQCPYTDSSCQYRVSSGDGQPFFFFGGTPPEDPPGSGQLNPNPQNYNIGTIHLPPPQVLHLGTLGAVGTADPNGGPGTIHLSAPGTHDDAALSDPTLTYEWVLQSPSGKIYTGTGESFDTTVDEDGAYCVELKVTASDGYSVSTPACTAGGASFVISGVAPTKKPDPAPGPGGGGGGVGGGGPSGGGFGGIVFSNPATRAPAALTGGGSTPTIVWLWRPEWYQQTPQASHTPRTSGQPVVKGHREIVVQRAAPQGDSAGPWLAGLGAFGLLGGGWVLSRRRRLKMLAEL